MFKVLNIKLINYWDMLNFIFFFFTCQCFKNIYCILFAIFIWKSCLQDCCLSIWFGRSKIYVHSNCTFSHILPLEKHLEDSRSWNWDRDQSLPLYCANTTNFLRKDTIIWELFGRNIRFLVFVLGLGSNLGLAFKSSAPKVKFFV